MKVRLRAMISATVALGWAPIVPAWIGHALAQQGGVAVQVGGETDSDACATIGRTTGTAVVRTGPGDAYAELARLPAGVMLAMCQSDPSGRWEGVLEMRDGVDCGVGTPIVPRQAYRGPCNAGWIENRNIEVVAG